MPNAVRRCNRRAASTEQMARHINCTSIVEATATALPRFTADELDDVDHSATTTQDNGTLKRGKLPTVEAIGKYREVMAKRNGTVAEAVKASGIDCEVAQYVLERWAGGLSDKESWRLLLKSIQAWSNFDPPNTSREVDSLFGMRCSSAPPRHFRTCRHRSAAPASGSRRTQARMTALQAQLAKERAARVAEPTEELSRFALEVDEAADPCAVYRSVEGAACP